MEIILFKPQRFLRLLRFLLFTAFIYSFISCKNEKQHSYSYPHQKEISDPLGLPNSSHTLYYPVEINQQKTGIDSLPVVWKSFRLNLMNEVVLYNYYLNNDLFRLTVFPSFSPVKTFKFFKQGNDVHVVVKTLSEKGIGIPGTFQIAVNEDGTIDTTKHLEETSFPGFESHTFILKNKWDELTEQVSKIHFLELPNTSNHIGLDGTTFILEQHSKDRYWFVDRWSPCMSPLEKNNADCKFESLCNYLLKLAYVDQHK